MEEPVSISAPPIPPWDGIDVSIAEVVNRLCEQRRPPEGGPPLTLAGVLNLIAHVPDPDDVLEMRSVIEGLASRQPSRAILLVEPDGGAGIDATVSTSCRLSGGNVTVGVELVVLSLHGDSRAGDASAIHPLLRSDLPTVLWWPDCPDPAPDGALARLAPLAGRIVTESGRAGAGARAITRLADWVPGVAGRVTDLAWAAITPWRQLVGQMMAADGPASGAPGPIRAQLVHGGPEPTTGALLFAGWLRDLAGDRLEVSMRGRSCPSALVGVTIEMPASNRIIAIERLPDRQAATVSVSEPGQEPRMRTLPLPQSDRSRLLAGELELQRRDHAFERALPLAAEVACR